MSSDIAPARLERHPCFSASAHGRYGRIHLPVARDCNLGCNYCERRIGGASYHSYGPGAADRILTPQEALARVTGRRRDAHLSVVGIAGPGEPLCNVETLETLRLVRSSFPDLMLCLSTNGFLLPLYVQRLCDLGLGTITVTVNAVDAGVGEKIYAFLRHNGGQLSGRAAAEALLENQLTGIREAARGGLIVKINSVLIPGVNDHGHLEQVARAAKRLGAYMQNITPLIPLGRFRHLRAPSCEELRQTRARCEQTILQFRLCEQCPADAVGPLGRSRKGPAGAR